MQENTLALQFAAQRGWKWVKADMKAAFLQGPASQEARNLFAIPIPELAAAMGVPHGQAVQDTTSPKMTTL